MKCPKCNTNEAIEHQTYGILPCQSCQNKDDALQVKRMPEFATLSKSNRLQHDRDTSGADWESPWIGDKANVKFIKAYPNLRKQYFTKKQMKEAV